MKEILNSVGILAPALRGWWFIVLSIIVAIVLSNRWLEYSIPTYESTAKIKLAVSEEGVPHTNLFKDFDIFATTQKIAGELELLKSPMMISKALDSLDFNVSYSRVGSMVTRELYRESPILLKYTNISALLYNKPISIIISNKRVFISFIINGNSYTYKTFLGKAISTRFAVLTVSKNQTLFDNKENIQLDDSYKIIVHNKDYLIKNVIGSNLDITSTDKDVPVIRISFKSPIPAKSAAFCNALAKAYIQDYIDTKAMAARTTMNFIDGQLGTLKTSLETSEMDIKNYRDIHKIVNIRQETETDLRKIADLRVQLANINANLAAVTYLESGLNKSGDDFLSLAPNFEAFNDLLSTEIIKKMQALSSEKKEYLLRYQKDNDKIAVLDAKILDLVNYLKVSIRNTKKSNEIKRSEIESALEVWKASFVDLPEKEKKMADMDRTFRLKEKSYIFLSEKRTEASIAQAAAISFHRMLAFAEIPTEQTTPKPTLVRIISGLLALLISLGCIYGLEGFQNRVRNTEDIESNSSRQVFSMVGDGNTIIGNWKNLLTQLIIQNISGSGKVTVIKRDRYLGKIETIYGPLVQAIEWLQVPSLILDVSLQPLPQLEWEKAFSFALLQGGPIRVPLPESNYWLKSPANWKATLQNATDKGYALFIIISDPLSDPSQLILMQMSDCIINTVVKDNTKKSDVYKLELFISDYLLPPMRHILIKSKTTFQKKSINVA
jgi:uncharacterized protein involved in exopolysaccharide biosynthesis